MSTPKIQLNSSGEGTSTAPKIQIIGSLKSEANLIKKIATENGTYKASDEEADGYSEFTVDVPAPEITTEEITVTPSKAKQEITPSNADYISKAIVNPIPDDYVIPEGTVNLNANGEHDVSGKAKAVVNVPIPDGYIKPSGTKKITTNGTHDVTDVAEAEVDVPIPEGYIVPSGSLEITENGEHNVTDKESVNVNVPIPEGYVIPEGEVSIDTNGEHDVSGKAKVVVNVPSIIDVTELPTSDIDTSKTYRMNGKLYRYEGKKPDVITDLTGTTWRVPSGWTVASGYDTYPNVNGVCNGNEFTFINLGYGARGKASNVIQIDSGYYTNTTAFIITFIGGSDLTRQNLISWLEANGEMEVSYEWVEYLVPEGSVTITENGTTDVTDKAEVVVDVPIPSGYIKPSGSLTITENGTVDVTDKEEVIVEVESSGSGGIIEVAELPTENIDTNAFYLCNGEYYRYVDRGNALIFNDELTNLVYGTYPLDFSFTKDGTPLIGTAMQIESWAGDSGAYLKFVTEETTYTVCTKNPGGTMNIWAKDDYKTVFITKMPTDESFLTWLNANTKTASGFVKYIVPTGELEITDNGTYDVTDKTAVKVAIKLLVQPTLNAPTIELDVETGILTITDTQNGNFANSYDVYNNGELIANITSTTYDVSSLLAQEYSFAVKSKGSNFNDSGFSNFINDCIGTWVFYETVDTSIGGFYVDFYCEQMNLAIDSAGLNIVNLDYLNRYIGQTKTGGYYFLYYVSNTTYYSGGRTQSYSENVFSPSAPEEFGFENVWMDEGFRTITIIGGTDIANETFVNWLKANATKIA